MALTPAQLALLDSFIYAENFNSKNSNYETVKDIINQLEDDKKAGVNIFFDEKGKTTGLDKNIFEGIKNDEALMNLKIGNLVNTGDGNNPGETGFRAATFTDESGNTAVIFRGTIGDYQWMDNAKTGYTVLSPSQQEVLYSF